MSVCCPPYTQLFSNVAVLQVAYGDSMKAKYGIVPDAEVYVYDMVQDKFVLYPYPVINIISDEINFDFGGVSTGYIKIS